MGLLVMANPLNESPFCLPFRGSVSSYLLDVFVSFSMKIAHEITELSRPSNLLRTEVT